MTPFSTSLDGVAPTQLRGVAWLSMSEQGWVMNRGGTTNEGGGGSTTWTAQGTIPCRYDPLGGSEGEVAHQMEDRSTHLITLPPLTEIGTEDRFEIEDVGTFEITAERPRTREWLHFVEAVKLD